MDVVTDPPTTDVMNTPDPAKPPTPTTGTEVMFGVTFTLNGTQVPVYAKDVTHASANGMEFTLPQPIDLGTFNDFANWFHSQFGVTIPATDTFPPPLNEIAGKLSTLDVAVDMLHVKVPPAAPAGQTRGPVQYTVALRAVFPAPGLELIPGVLEIQGAVFGVSNEGR